MKVVALVVGSLLGAATIRLLPEAERCREWHPWIEQRVAFDNHLRGPIGRWFAPPPEPPKVRFE